MKNFIAVIILILSVLNIKLYPYIIVDLPDRYKPVLPINKLLTQQNNRNIEKEYNIPKAIAAGTLVTGETIAGFTLAEVLITLLIIGVVASLVIPNLIQETQDAELNVAWKKEYGVLSQATRRIIAENGGSFKGLSNTFDHDVLRDQYLQYLSIVKKCNGDHPGPANTYGNCWHTHGATSGIDKYLNGNDIGKSFVPLGGGNAGAILNDGSFMIFSYEDSTCSSSPMVDGTYEGLTNICGWITVDINGAKQPNRVGKDIFAVWITENRIFPLGIKNFNNTCVATSTGLGCSAKYLYQ